MTRLSVNINKVATLRNARGGNKPDLLRFARDAERFGAQGITVHPRPDERHIRYADVRGLSPIVTTELNIEGNPREPRFVELVLEVRPAQVTLVPDALGQLTSDHGWDTRQHADYLREIVATFKAAGIRTSLFVDPLLDQIEGAAGTGTDRVELYTEAYAHGYGRDRGAAVAPYVAAARRATELGLGLNAGHDLDLDNLRYFADRVAPLHEVSIGHALIADALYLGIEPTIQRYRAELASG
jgi:pyridoxine 5-phosphate synthase